MLIIIMITSNNSSSNSTNDINSNTTNNNDDSEIMQISRFLSWGSAEEREDLLYVYHNTFAICTFILQRNYLRNLYDI